MPGFTTSHTCRTVRESPRWLEVRHDGHKLCIDVQVQCAQSPNDSQSLQLCDAVFTCIYVHVHIHFVDWVLVSVDLILNHRLCIYTESTCSIMTLIRAHELHGRMHPNQSHLPNLVAVDPLSLLAYFTVSHTHLVTGN